ncbi:uncharacterized protein LOC141641954 [Silene latifolia]|uniref:uncharacterized protein LOC141641954 n=1 Tax=Silene latifolia TaxID=37657 RepID=UPI003D781A81
MECIPYSHPRFIAGMLYWCDICYPCYAMDVDTENFYYFPKPDDFVQIFSRSCFISLGTGLGLIQGNTIDKKSLWKLTDVKSGEWTEVVGININVAYSTVRNALLPTHIDSFPVMLIDDMFWFNHVIDHIDKEYVLIRFNLVDQSFVVFPMKRKDMEIRKRPRASATAEVVPHRHRYPTRWKLRQEKANVTVDIPCKRNKVVKCILYLPRDIIFNILLLIPATFLHQVVRYVCKQWNDIVNDSRFIKAHCQLSSVGLLVQSPLDPPQVYYIEGDNSKEFAFPYPGRIYGSFNGLVLFQDMNNPQILSVINPLTKARMNLPPVQGLKYLSCIGFAITSCGHYKVVVAVHDAHHYPKIHVMVFTIGIDKAWRFIDLQGNSKMECRVPYFLPLFIAGMLYWCNYYYPCYAMDVDTETIYDLPKPDDFVQNFNQSFFISLGAGLGLIVNKTDERRLWKLTDVKSGEWTEVVGININAAYRTLRKELFPKDTNSFPYMLIDDMLWFNHGIDGRELFLIRFNLVDQSFVLFPIKHKYGFRTFFHHVHTLLSPKKCYL